MADISIIVFLGPSLDLNAARSILPDADYRPPASRGDVEKAAAENPDIICLIDGVFFEQCSVGHREILGALRKGIRFFGASSMGALRASEMELFGMQGVGHVYSLYKDGILDSDDEVAVVCDPFSNQPLSEALVSIRATLQKAKDEKILTKDECETMFQTAAGLYYPERTYDFLIETARENNIVGESSLHSFENWIRNGNAADVKKEDAISALKVVKEAAGEI
ncbi:MAG: TfuA-related McrA-glycine thioamidation protein [Methanimicrococcus sp.]|nr:TfuA-related McrA-glycine thioamidation protein [Methanimicrococcus sp.]